MYNGRPFLCGFDFANVYMACPTCFCLQWQFLVLISQGIASMCINNHCTLEQFQYRLISCQAARKHCWLESAWTSFVFSFNFCCLSSRMAGNKPPFPHATFNREIQSSKTRSAGRESNELSYNTPSPFCLSRLKSSCHNPRGETNRKSSVNLTAAASLDS